MSIELIFLILEIIVIISAYLVGKYIVPKLSQDDLKILELVKGWIETFVSEAASFKEYTGTEKKQYVIEQITKILNEKNIILTEEQISALIEAAYNNFKKGKQESETMKAMHETIILQNNIVKE